MQRYETTIINELYSRYQANGFITEDETLACFVAHHIPLKQVDSITDHLLSVGVIIKINDSQDDNEEETYDRTRIDYDIIFNKALRTSPELASLINYIRNIKPPQHCEWQILIPQAQNGNQYAQNRLFEMYLRVAFYYALQFHKTIKIELDDILQECMIGLFKAIRDFRIEKHTSFIAFLQLCINRQVITMIKTSTRKKHAPLNSYISLNEILEKSEMNYSLFNDISCLRIFDVEDFVIRKEEYAILLEKSNAVLSLMEQKVFSYYLDGKSYAEIAVDLHRPIKSIDNAIQRIKIKLGHLLEQELSVG